MDCNAKPCIYEMFCCGVLRNCLLRDELPGEGDGTINRKRKRCGVLTFTVLTFLFGLIMELSHYSFFSNIFDSLKPYYLHDVSLEMDVRNKIWELNAAKTIVFTYFFAFSIVLRLSKFVVGGLVCIFLWPVILIYYYIAKADEKIKQQEAEEKAKEEARR